MKTKITIFIFMVCFMVKQTRAQDIYSTGHPLPPCPQAYPDWHQSTSQPTVCSQLLKDFVPSPHDRVLTVNLNFFMYNKTDGTGRWSAATSVQADSLVAKLNRIYSTLIVTSQPRPVPAAYIQDTKIRFKKKTYSVLNNTQVYDSIGSTQFISAFPDCNGINLIFSNYVAGNISGANTYQNPSKYIYLPADTDLDYLGNMRTLNSDASISTLSHELGHALGLGEAWNLAGYASAKTTFGCNSICDQVLADDFSLDSYPASGGTWGVRHLCDDSLWRYSNNIMSYNDNCRHYFSPLQIALMRYHLHTDMKEVLSDAPYDSCLRVNHAFDYQLSANESWTSDRFMKGDVIIPSGITLTVYGALAMTQKARIIVKVGGGFILNGAVTNISGQLWSGVQVGGTSTLDQSLTSGGLPNHQGLFKAVSSAACLSNAENAIKNYRTDSLGTIDFTSTGGIILATGVTFENNARDVEFLSYSSYSSGSRFNLCNFKTTSMMNNSSTTGLPAAPTSHVSMWDVRGVQFKGCTFEYSSSAGNAYTDHGLGITSMDANYTIDKNGTTSTAFNTLRKGVYVLNNNPLIIPVIKNTSFTNNTEDGAYFQNLTALNFNNNIIQPLGGVQSNGVYLNSCQEYNVKNNTIAEATGQTKASSGITAYNSAAGSHQIYRNNCSNLQIGISAVGNNSGSTNSTNGLRMNCNDFSATSNLYDIALQTPWPGLGALPTVMSKQGNTPITPTYLDPVRNIYAATSGCSSCENKWYIQGTSIKARYTHPSNTQAATQPTPQPANSDTAVKVVYTGLALNYTAACTSGQNSNGNGTVNPTPQVQLQNINSYLSGLVANNTSDINHFEIEASLTSKLNLFSTDSVLNNKDSVVNLLKGNTSRLESADVLTVYALMNKGDITGAQTAINNLSTKRASWVPILNKQLDYKSNPLHLYKMSSTDITFWQSAASNESNTGFGAAQAILRRFQGQNFSDPRPFPASGSGSRLMHTQVDPIATEKGIDLSVYPNPANDLITVAYNSNVGRILDIHLADALGSLVYQGKLVPGEKLTISTSGLNNGLYLVTAYDMGIKVYHNKIICIK